MNVVHIHDDDDDGQGRSEIVDTTLSFKKFNFVRTCLKYVAENYSSQQIRLVIDEFYVQMDLLKFFNDAKWF